MRFRNDWKSKGNKWYYSVLGLISLLWRSLCIPTSHVPYPYLFLHNSIFVKSSRMTYNKIHRFKNFAYWDKMVVQHICVIPVIEDIHAPQSIWIRHSFTHCLLVSWLYSPWDHIFVLASYCALPPTRCKVFLLNHRSWDLDWKQAVRVRKVTIGLDWSSKAMPWLTEIPTVAKSTFRELAEIGLTLHVKHIICIQFCELSSDCKYSKIW